MSSLTGEDMKHKQSSRVLRATQILFFINGTVWLLFGVLSTLRFLEQDVALRWIYALLMTANGLGMLLFGLLIIRGSAKIVVVAMLYIGLNAVLSITDQFGVVDALILLLNLCLLGLLIAVRSALRTGGDALE